MANSKQTIFFFMPLASIGGTEIVHLDILNALKDLPIKTYVRYSSNVWKGKISSQKSEAKKEGKAMVNEFKKYSSVTFLDKYLEAPRFGRFIRKLFIKRLSNRINRSSESIVIFWHRESIEFIFDKLEPHVKIIDIIHNNSNNLSPDPKYLLIDWVSRIDQRILVSEGLVKWLAPLYLESDFMDGYWNKIKVIEHCVQFPESGFIEKSKDPFHILFIGRDSHEKRFDIILKIALSLTHLNKQLIFTIIGPDSEKYKTYSNEQIIFRGEIMDREKINYIYTNSHVILLTSSSEGFPKVLSEAMAFSCIPVTTGVGDIVSHITHGKNGFITNTDDPIHDSMQIIQTLYEQRVLFNEVSKNAYLYAKEKFAEERFKNEWTKVIESLS